MSKGEAITTLLPPVMVWPDGGPNDLSQSPGDKRIFTFCEQTVGMTEPAPSFLQTLAEMIGFVGLPNIATAFIALNFMAFAAFGIDKAKAEAGAWRVKESTLLTLAFLGGTPGAYAGRALFRHKTRKQPFNENLQAIVVLQMVAASGLTGWWIAG